LTLLKNVIVLEVDLDVVLLELVLELKGEVAKAALVGHHLVLDPLVVDEGGALRKRLTTHVTIKGSQTLVHVNVATQVEGRTTLKAAYLAFMLTGCVVLSSVVSQAGLVDERLTALLTSDRALAGMCQ
jgi:hypothetical protein